MGQKRLLYSFQSAAIHLGMEDLAIVIMDTNICLNEPEFASDALLDNVKEKLKSAGLLNR